MLKRLRLQFVAVIMVIVTIMLCTVFGMLYFFTRSSLEQESFAMMRAVPVGIMAPDRPLAPFARPSEQPEQVRLPFFVVQEAEDGKYDVEMTFYHRRTGKGDLTDDRDLTAAVKSLRGMDRDVRDKLGRVKLALRYAYAGYYVDVTELDMNPFDGSLPEATRWTEREEN